MNHVEVIRLDADGNEIGRDTVTLAPEPEINAVPDEIKMWQARAILLRAGLLGMVEQAVKVATNPEIEIAWEYAPNVVRRSAFVAAISDALGLPSEQIDNLFIEGAKIK